MVKVESGVCSSVACCAVRPQLQPIITTRRKKNSFCMTKIRLSGKDNHKSGISKMGFYIRNKIKGLF